MITKGEVYEFYVQNKSLNIKDFLHAFVNFYGDFADCKSTANLYRRIQKVYSKISELKKNKTKKNKEKLSTFESEQFDVNPNQADQSTTSTTTELMPEVQQIAPETTADDEQANSASGATIAELRDCIKTLEQENADLRVEKMTMNGHDAQNTFRTYENNIAEMKKLAQRTEEQYDKILIAHNSDQEELKRLKTELDKLQETYQVKSKQLQESDKKVKQYSNYNVQRREKRNKDNKRTESQDKRK